MAVGVEFADVAGFKPAVFCKMRLVYAVLVVLGGKDRERERENKRNRRLTSKIFSGLLGVIVVTVSNDFTPDPDLALSVRLVCAKVSGVGEIDEFDLVADFDVADGVHGPVTGVAEGAHTAHKVTLINIPRKEE